MLEREGTKVKLTSLPEATIVSEKECMVIYRNLYLPRKMIGIAPENEIEKCFEGI